MADDTYSKVTAQAWQQYQTTSDRKKNYISLLEPAIKQFESAVSETEGALVFSSPPTKEQLAKANGKIVLLESAFSGVENILDKFVQMDADAVKSTGTVSQGSVKSQNTTNQQEDAELSQALNNVVYSLGLIVAAGYLEAGQ